MIANEITVTIPASPCGYNFIVVVTIEYCFFWYQQIRATCYNSLGKTRCQRKSNGIDSLQAPDASEAMLVEVVSRNAIEDEVWHGAALRAPRFDPQYLGGPDFFLSFTSVYSHKLDNDFIGCIF